MFILKAHGRPYLSKFLFRNSKFVQLLLEISRRKRYKFYYSMKYDRHGATLLALCHRARQRIPYTLQYVVNYYIDDTTMSDNISDNTA